MNHILIIYKGYTYKINKKYTESYNDFYERAWLIAKKEPRNKKDYNTALISAQIEMNKKKLGYSY